MGVYLPQGYEPLTAQHIVNRYVQIIDELEYQIYNDYVDNIEYQVDDPNTFNIHYIPAENNLRFYINGVFYEEDTHYTLDRENKEIKWLFTGEEGGFKLEPHYKYFAVYDIYLKDNEDLETINDIEEF
jgi:hypothetical protein